MGTFNEWAIKGKNIKLHYWCYFMVAVWLFVAQASAQEPLLAFPGAEGFGRLTKGGRGGPVVEVMNLKDAGPGSLRQALSAMGPRTVIFRVGGIIELQNSIRITEPYLTVAGQTAPGDGITIKGGMLDVRTHDVIIRHIRVRPGPGAPNPEGADSIQVTRPGSHNIILDHVSMSWGVDELFSTWGNANEVSNVSVQWSIVSEALHCATPSHPEGCHGKGVLLGNGSSQITFHHNLLIHNDDRNAEIQGGKHDFVNNVIYNWGSHASVHLPYHAPLKMNLVGNYYIPGPSSPLKPPVRLYGGKTFGGRPLYSASSEIYLKGNLDTLYRPNNSEPETKVLKLINGGFSVAQARFDYPPVTTTDASQAKIDVLAYAGANGLVTEEDLVLDNRDAIDQRLVNDVLKGTGRIINDPSQVGGYAPFTSKAAPLDTDHDGMPDTWELGNGLNVEDGSDGSWDTDHDGYTNLEEYLNGTLSVKEDVTPPDSPTGVHILR